MEHTNYSSWDSTIKPSPLTDDDTAWLEKAVKQHRTGHTTEEMPAIELAGTPQSHERAFHRLRVTILVITATAILYAAQSALWPRNPLLHGWFSDTWSWLGFIWAAAFIPAACELAGLFLWHPPRSEPQPIGNLVCYRIVSRGINKEALSATINAIRVQMRQNPMFPYVIETVVDTDTGEDGLPPDGGDLHYLRVPSSYQTPNGTLAKARALNYALEASPIVDNVWILHCDEETHPTRSGIDGIAAAISEEERLHPSRPRIGQGTITYHRDWEAHPFFTLSDCVRTGSDLGRLFLSMKAGIPLFGLHGSFILIRSDVEKQIGLDLGPVGSLTEDAWFGAIAVEKGYRCRWVEGHMAEQCTHRVPDFLKQRRRWFTGMFRTSLHAPVSLRWRATMIMSMAVWASAPLAWIYTIGHFAIGGYTPPEVRFLANVSLAVYIATTLIGLRINMRDHGVTAIFHKAKWAVAWLACLPVFSFLESVAVSYAILKPANGFHVVKK